MTFGMSKFRWKIHVSSATHRRSSSFFLQGVQIIASRDHQAHHTGFLWEETCVMSVPTGGISP